MQFNTAGAAAGASAGAVAGPWGAAIGGVVGGFMGGGGNSGSGTGGATATPQASQAAAFGSGIDSSAWIVNFGNGNSNTIDNRQDKTITSTGPTAAATPTAGASPYYGNSGGLYGGYGVDPLASLGLSGIPPYVWLILGAAVLYRLSRKK